MQRTTALIVVLAVLAAIAFGFVIGRSSGGGSPAGVRSAIPAASSGSTPASPGAVAPTAQAATPAASPVFASPVPADPPTPAGTGSPDAADPIASPATAQLAASPASETAPVVSQTGSAALQRDSAVPSERAIIALATPTATADAVIAVDAPPTAAATTTATLTPPRTPTPAASAIPSATASATRTPTGTSTATHLPTPTATSSPTATKSPSATPTPTPTPSFLTPKRPTATPTPTPSASANPPRTDWFGTAGAPFVERGGTVTLEAEAAQRSSTGGAHRWLPAAEYPGFAGDGYVWAAPDIAGAVADCSPKTAELDVAVDFRDPGTYVVWVRGWAADGGGNSVCVGLDGKPAAAGPVTGFTRGRWTWHGGDAAVPVVVEVTEAGVHTVNLWMREDGLAVDRVVLTTDGGGAPSGAGPAASARSVPTNPPTTVATASAVVEGDGTGGL